MRRLRILLAVSLTFACACLVCVRETGAQQQEPQEDELPTCDVFALRDTAFTITVPVDGGTFELGGGSQVTFAPNAVDAATSYRIRIGTRARGRRIAGFSIDAVGGGRSQFAQPVTLRVGYAGCPFENTDQPLYIVRRGAGKPERVGGTRSTAGKFIEAVVNRFSAFAIAT
jgi:hypothetical protein